MPQRANIWRIAQELDAQLGDLPQLRAELSAMLEHQPHLLRPWLAVIEHAEIVLGDLTRAVTWLRSPNPVLNGAMPATLLREPDGAEQVRHILTKMQQQGAF